MTDNPSNEVFGNALANTVDRLLADEGGVVEDCTREKWCGGDVPEFAELAAKIGWPLRDLLDVFTQELCKLTNFTPAVGPMQ